MWKQAWWLVGKEIKFQWRAFTATMIATFIISLAVINVLVGIDSRGELIQETFYFRMFMMDFIFLGLTPSFAAIYMAGPYLSFRSFNEDPFGKRLAVYRALPVPIGVLIRSRMLLMLVTLLTMSAVFYTSIITALNVADMMPNIGLLVSFICTWFGYALALGTVNAYVEFGTNGRVLWIYPFVFVLTFLGTAIFIHRKAGTSIVEWSYTLAQNYGWAAAVISIVIGAVISIGVGQLLKKRLLKRDYL